MRTHERERDECKEQEYEASTASSTLHTAAAQHQPVQPVESHAEADADGADADGGADGSSDADAAPQSWVATWRRKIINLIPQTLMGWPLLFTYFLLTFAQQLPTTAVGIMLAKELHFEPDEVSRFYAATFVPWTIRPVYAFLSDQVPIFSYRRKPYFVVCALLACGAQFSLSQLGHSKYNFLVLAVATQLFLAFCEVVCDSLSVEWGNELAIRVVAAQIERAKSKAAACEPAAPESEAVAATPLKSPSWLRGRAKTPPLGKEWTTPLLSGSSADSASGGINGSTSHAAPAICSSASTPLVTSATTAAAGRSDGSNRSYSSLATEDTKERTSSKSLRCMVADHGSPQDSPSSSAAGSPLPAVPALPADPADARADAKAARVIAHLFATTSDPSKLTPLVLKSRIQSECMSIRTTGSVVASALTTWVLLKFLSPRSVLMWTSLAFVLGIFSMLFYRLERKVGRGYFGLAATGTQEQEAAAAVAATGSTPPLAGATVHGSETAQVDAATIAVNIAASENAAPSPAGPTAVSVSDDPRAPLSTAAASDDDSSSSSSGSTSDPSICMMERSRWQFLWAKLLSLLRALRLLLGPLLFIFLVNVMPSSMDAYYNYLYSDYSEFSNSQFSSFNFLGLVGSLLGCLLYQRFVARTRIDIRAIFLVTTLVSSAAGCAQIVLATKSNHRIGIGDEWWLLSSSLLVSGLQILAQLPPIILASHFAPRGLGLEASMFSLFAASAHLGALVSAEVTAHITVALGISQGNWSALWQLILLCNLSDLLPLLLMPLLLHPRITGRREIGDAAPGDDEDNNGAVKKKNKAQDDDERVDGQHAAADSFASSAAV